MPFRLLALLLLLAVLPTAELVEQGVHVIEHLAHHETPDHTAHHDEHPGDEHGCTGLVHLCGCHQTQVTAGVAFVVTRQIDTVRTDEPDALVVLVDMTSPEPAQRPPIA